MKKDNRTKFCGALLVISGFATILWAGLRIGGDNLAQKETKKPVSEKQTIIKEFFPTNKKNVALGFFGAIAMIAGMGLTNKSKEK